jgi:hypothetical protein
MLLKKIWPDFVIIFKIVKDSKSSFDLTWFFFFPCLLQWLAHRYWLTMRRGKTLISAILGSNLLTHGSQLVSFNMNTKFWLMFTTLVKIVILLYCVFCPYLFKHFILNINRWYCQDSWCDVSWNLYYLNSLFHCILVSLHLFIHLSLWALFYHYLLFTLVC